MRKPYDHDDAVEIVTKDTPYNGYFQIDVYHLKHRTFAGGTTDVMSREVFERGHAVAAVLYDPDRDKLVMIEQFRIGAYVANWENPWLIEIVAGIVEDGETPLDVVRREAVEEANCTVTDLDRLARYLATPGGSSESLEVYCGRVDSTNADGIYGLAHEHEDIRVFTVDPAEAFGWLDDQKIENSMALIGLYAFRSRYAEFKEKWAPGA